VTSQRDERLERTAASRMVTISSALANCENALQGGPRADPPAVESPRWAAPM